MLVKLLTLNGNKKKELIYLSDSRDERVLSCFRFRKYLMITQTLDACGSFTKSAKTGNNAAAIIKSDSEPVTGPIMNFAGFLTNTSTAVTTVIVMQAGSVDI